MTKNNNNDYAKESKEKESWTKEQFIEEIKNEGYFEEFKDYIESFRKGNTQKERRELFFEENSWAKGRVSQKDYNEKERKIRGWVDENKELSDEELYKLLIDDHAEWMYQADQRLAQTKRALKETERTTESINQAGSGNKGTPWIKNNFLVLSILGVLLLFLVIYISTIDNVEPKKEEYRQLKAKVLEGDLSWVKSNSARITVINESPWSGKKYKKNDEFWEIQQFRSNFMKDMANIVANEASKESTVESAYQVLYDFENMTTRNPKTNKKHINVPLLLKNWEEINLETQLSIFQSFGEKYDDVVFDLTDRNFIKDELCRAVGEDEIMYVAILIGFADFDVGYLRCYDTREYGYFQYAAANGRAEPCPMSLRRVSGINAGIKIASRNSTWLHNLEQSGAAESKNIKEMRKRFQSSFQNLPSLSGVDDMNSLLDKYNKWAFGGNCSTDLEEGYSLPGEFR